MAQNGSLLGGADIKASKREDASGGGPQRAALHVRESGTGFLDVNGIEVGRDIWERKSFASEQIREFDITAAAVRKAILTIEKFPAIVRPSLATFVNSAGLVEISPVNTTRFDHHPITLAPRGLLVE